MKKSRCNEGKIKSHTVHGHAGNREEEMEQFRSHQVYENVPPAEAASSGAKLITTRWVGVKGDKRAPSAEAD